ncbi:hypothetical protein NA56DRAFT_443380 [Hyaloscypha hepaticicola]|uniref:Uncharacterized protein n=1 Tax=Hyaloscypha hepaticicola TaxID=2082293 RepID=A0A2J6PGG2_9HELO|nr:hypothetical protein NA56DRAFT_443380 [Hyaloscypha hepaticicola]
MMLRMISRVFTRKMRARREGSDRRGTRCSFKILRNTRWMMGWSGQLQDDDIASLCSLILPSLRFSPKHCSSKSGSRAQPLYFTQTLSNVLCPLLLASLQLSGLHLLKKSFGEQQVVSVSTTGFHRPYSWTKKILSVPPYFEMKRVSPTCNKSKRS